MKQAAIPSEALIPVRPAGPPATKGEAVERGGFGETLDAQLAAEPVDGAAEAATVTSGESDATAVAPPQADGSAGSETTDAAPVAAGLPGELLGAIAQLGEGLEPALPQHVAASAAVSAVTPLPGVAEAGSPTVPAATAARAAGVAVSTVPTPTADPALGASAATQGPVVAAALAAAGQGSDEATDRRVNGGSAARPALESALPPAGLASSTNASPGAPVDGARALPALSAPVGGPDFGRELGARVALGVAAGIGSATLELNPKDLGPVSIQLTVNEDETALRFTSAHLAVRDAIESSLPRLREALAEEGLRLGEVSVGVGDGAGADVRDDAAGSSDGGAEGTGDADDPTDPRGAATPARLSEGLVDTFA